MLAVAIVGAITVTAFAASDNTNSGGRPARAAWGEKNLDPFKSLLDNGVVSQSTYDKMKVYLEENMTKKVEHSEQKNILDELLKADIITQTEYDAMKAAMPTSEKADIQRPTFGKQPANGEKPALSDKPQRANFFDSFVEDGIITDKTATAIQEHLKSRMPDKSESKGNVKERVDIYAKMLEAGVITQAEYDAIKVAMPEQSDIAKRGDKAANK